MHAMAHSMCDSQHKICSVVLRDPRWRVAPYGWFSDEEEQTTKPERKKFKGADEGKRFHCVSDQELDRPVTAKPPVNAEY